MRKPYYWTARKVWCVRVPGDGGKLQLVRLGTTKKAAYDRWHAMIRLAESEDGIGERTVSTLVDMYVADRMKAAEAGEINAKALQRNRDYLSDFQVEIGETLTPSKVKPYHVHEWLDKQADRWGANTRYHAASSVKRSMEWAVERGYLSSNPIAAVKVAKGAGRDFVIDRAAYEKLISGWKQWKKSAYDFRSLLIGLRQTGCRPGEIIAVRVEHVSADGETWVLPDHKNRKKKQRPRVVYLSPCMQTMTRILADGRKSGPLFRNPSGEPWQYADIRRTFHRLRERSKTDPKCVLYSFRHTWITQALVAGVDVATVAEMAGTSIQMIDRHYGHLSKHHDHMRRAAVIVSQSWTG